jgi:DnaJ family protein A protein 2
MTTTPRHHCTRDSCRGQPLTGFAKVGPDRYFWIAYPCYNAAVADEHPAHGYAASAAKADAAIFAAVGRIGSRPHAKNATGAKYARQYLHRLAVERRMQKTSTATDAATLTFVYRHWISDYDGAEVWTPYRIVKTTKTRVYVDAERYRPDLAVRPDDWIAHDRPAFLLDRAQPESNGYAWKKRSYACFYTEAGKQDHEAERRLRFNGYRTPDCLSRLGLGHGATITEIKRAYRRLALQHHPDRGGDAATFMAITSAYEQAVTSVRGAA